jgi:hypothetical protein
MIKTKQLTQPIAEKKKITKEKFLSSALKQIKLHKALLDKLKDA